MAVGTELLTAFSFAIRLAKAESPLMQLMHVCRLSQL